MRKIALICLLVLISACTSTSLINVWDSKTIPAQPLTKILVLGVSDQQSTKRSFEDLFSAQLAKHQVEAIPGYLVVPEGKEKDHQAIREIAQKNGAQGVLVVHYQGVDTRQEYVPPTITPTYYHGFGRYYPFVYGYVHQPGYYINRKYLRLESNLYQVSDGKLLWAASSETLEPVSIRTLVRELSDAIMQDLKKKGLIL